MESKRIHAKIEGRVQGVFFRDCTRAEAKRLALRGWVRNRPDGSVECEAEGPVADVDLFVNWLYKGSPASEVTRVSVDVCQTLGSEKEFCVQY